ncbi:MAG: HIT family protein [Hyphomicrobiales bacterium]
MKAEFELDARLAADSVPVADLALSTVRAMRDANYPWLLVVPKKAGAVELIDLDCDERAVLVEEIAAVSEALKAATGCDKLNVAALGNVVSQLHVHVIARFASDAAWPGPVWNKVPATAYAAGALDAFVARIADALPGGN